ncbi:hypothetical protein HOY80DRAFT_658132 [Tuber brumale]|nr:hypothetical protein HOY80DRAFT_658132 [Tuber brumale]
MGFSCCFLPVFFLGLCLVFVAEGVKDFFCLLSWRLGSVGAWVGCPMCGWSQTRGTWGGLFFPWPVEEVFDQHVSGPNRGCGAVITEVPLY